MASQQEPGRRELVVLKNLLDHPEQGNSYRRKRAIKDNLARLSGRLVIFAPGVGGDVDKRTRIVPDAEHDPNKAGYFLRFLRSAKCDVELLKVEDNEIIEERSGRFRIWGDYSVLFETDGERHYREVSSDESDTIEVQGAARFYADGRVAFDGFVEHGGPVDRPRAQIVIDSDNTFSEVKDVVVD